MVRALHFVLKIADRKKSIKFYRDLLGMKILRHEEFDEGCQASCNGPYQNAWSKTMIGYGEEDDNFILELTYNYPIKSYKLGNDIRNLVIESSTALNRIKKEFALNEDKEAQVNDPDGYSVTVRGGIDDKLTQVTLNVESLKGCLDFWEKILGFDVIKKEDAKEALIKFQHTNFSLNFIEIGQKIDHATGWGRVAFAAPINDIVKIYETIKKMPGKHILHDLVELGTPGKASVKVVILLDSDGYEICFVGDEDYRKLSKSDANADEIYEKAIAEEEAVLAKRNKSKTNGHTPALVTNGSNGVNGTTAH